MSDDIEELDWGGPPHPVLNKLMIGSAGVAVGALVVAVGPGLVTSSAAHPHAQAKHPDSMVFSATCTVSGCRPWIVREGSLPTLVTRITPGPNAAAVCYGLTHEGCP
jgi:hypothetical protein